MLMGMEWGGGMWSSTDLQGLFPVQLCPLWYFSYEIWLPNLPGISAVSLTHAVFLIPSLSQTEISCKAVIYGSPHLFLFLIFFLIVSVGRIKDKSDHCYSILAGCYFCFLIKNVTYMFSFYIHSFETCFLYSTVWIKVYPC